MWKGTVVMITGASSGIGAELALRLAGRGALIALLARDEERLERVRDQALAMAAPGADARCYICDVTDEDAVRSTVERVAEEMGPPGVLINSAGILTGGYFEELPVEDFRRVMEVNFMGALNAVKAALPHVKKGRDGRIINVSSIAGAMAVFGYSSYCASKFAISGFTESLRQELAPQGVRVHLVLPPETDTPMLRAIQNKRPPENKAVAAMVGGLPVETVAESIVKGVEKRKSVIVPGTRTRLLLRLGRMAPGLTRLASDLAIMRVYKGPGKGLSRNGHCCPWWFCFTFDNPLRRLVQKQEKIAGPHVREGMTVLDPGCGMGYFSVPMAKMVGESGKVICVDLQPEMLDALERRAARAGVLDRVVPKKAGRHGLGLSGCEAHFALAMWMAHEVPDQASFLVEVFDNLRPGGRFLAAEPVMHVSRRQFDALVEQAKQAGFEEIDRPPVGLSHAVLLGRPQAGAKEE